MTQRTISHYGLMIGPAFRVLAAALLLLVLPAIAFADAAPRNALIFYSDDPALPANVLVNNAIRSTFKEQWKSPIQIYDEGLDSFRIPSEEFESEMLRLFQRKYDGVQIDVIFTLGAPSLRFLLKHRDELFPGTPIIYVVNDRSRLADLNLASNITGASGEVESRSTLDLALELHPQTQRVVVIGGTTQIDQDAVARAHKEFQPYEGKLEFTYLTDLRLEEVRQRLTTLPDKSLIIYLSFARDAAGVSYQNPEVVSLLSSNSRSPVYAQSQVLLGSGIVGGRLLNYEGLGLTAAQMGLRILRGESTQNIPQQTNPTVYMFDWRQLKRWNIDESKLPSGSIVRFKQFSVWDLYKWHIIGVIALIILQAALIMVLLVNLSQRRKAEEESKASEKRYRNVVETQTELICRYRDDSTLTFVNDAYCRYFGKTRDQLIGTKFTQLLPEYARAPALSHVASLIDRRSAEPYEHEVVLPDGKIGWQQWIDHVVENNGHGIELQGIGRDITERRMAEEELRLSEMRFREMADSSPVMIWIADTNMLCTYFNRRCLDLTGRSMEELLGLGWLKAVHEDDAQRCVDIYTAAYAARESFVYEFRLRHADGEYRWVYSSGVPRFASNGELLGYIGSAVDITDRKLSEDAVRESEARFRHMADNAPVLIWVSDTEPQIAFVNKQCLEFTGLGMEAMLGDGWLELVDEDDRQRCIDIYTAAFERREPFVYEYRIRHADGELHWLYSAGAPRFAPDGEFLGYIGSCVDISDRKEAEAALQLAHEELNKLKNQLQAENIYLQEEIRLAHNVDEIIGDSNAIKYVLFKIEQVAQTDTGVLILGETGTGKELVARAIHAQSRRKDRPLVKVNCAVLSASLIESELFGHEKGAFTGATARKIGRFELADGATIFLDEIGELPLELQAKLLRVIQEGEIERLGSSRTIKVDVRLIAATNRNLKLEVEKGNFREDLWYRLNVFPITLPPLRQRKEDIPLLIEHFTRMFAKKVGKTVTSISSTTMKEFQNHSWPGNVRELANVLERAVINTSGGMLRLVDRFEKSETDESQSLDKTLEEIERDYITRILDNTGWRIEGRKGAAKILGLNPSTLRTRMVKLGIHKLDQSPTLATTSK